MHPHTKGAAQAAEAAGAQGSFWEMHDMLFENQDDLGRDHLAAYAEAFGLDATRLIDELITGTYAKHVVISGLVLSLVHCGHNSQLTCALP